MERDNFHNDYEVMDKLHAALSHTENYEVEFYTGDRNYTLQLLDKKKWMRTLPVWLRKPLKAIILLRYPRRWGFYFSWFKEETIDDRCKKLKRYLKKRRNCSDIIILSRSANCRVSSIVADELGIKKLICLGYPFRNPRNPVEPERFMHLRQLKTPCLILQGERDEYGGLHDIPNLYELSSQISLVFVDTDHDFRLSETQWDMVTAVMKDYIAN